MGRVAPKATGAGGDGRTEVVRIAENPVSGSGSTVTEVTALPWGPGPALRPSSPGDVRIRNWYGSEAGMPRRELGRGHHGVGRIRSDRSVFSTYPRGGP